MKSGQWSGWEQGLRIHTIQVKTLILFLTSWVTLGKSINLILPQLCTQNGHNDTKLLRLLLGLNASMSMKCYNRSGCLAGVAQLLNIDL